MHTLLSSREHAHADGQRGREMTPRASLSCVVILPKALAGTRVPRSWCALGAGRKRGYCPHLSAEPTAENWLCLLSLCRQRGNHSKNDTCPLNNVG